MIALSEGWFKVVFGLFLRWCVGHDLFGLAWNLRRRETVRLDTSALVRGSIRANLGVNFGPLVFRIRRAGCTASGKA